MALTTCRDCGGKVSSSSTYCRRCGAKKPWWRWWYPIAFILLMLALAIWASDGDDKGPSRSADRQDVPEASHTLDQAPETHNIDAPAEPDADGDMASKTDAIYDLINRQTKPEDDNTGE